VTPAVLIPIPAGSKKTLVPGWSADPPPPMTIGPNDNVGRRLDDDVDVDLDCAEAQFAARTLLLKTDCKHGRPSTGVTHCWFKAAGAAYEMFTDVVKQRDEGGKQKYQTLVEIRTGRSHYTVVPPSRVAVSGNDTFETLRWFADGEPGAYEFSRLRTSVLHVAITALIARHFVPDGERWKFYEALAGFLLGNVHLPADAVTRILETAAEIVKDGDTTPRPAEWVRRTESRLAKGQECTGAPTVAEMIGKHGAAVVEQIQKWCGVADPLAAAIDRLNERFAIIGVENKIVVMERWPDGSIKQLWPFDEFKKLLVKDRISTEVESRGKTVTRVVSLADAWLTDRRGRQYERLVYDMPGSAERCRDGDYNGYLGFTVTPASGDWSLNQRHVEKIICGGDEALFLWLINWMAALVQWPGRHAFTAVVLRGGQGVGKGHFAHLMLGSLFHKQQYLHIIGAGMLTGRFNEHLSGKVLVFADESTWGGDAQAADKLKGMVTESTIPIERKFLPLVEEPSALHILIASNNEWPIAIAPDDRRFCVFDVSADMRQNDDYFRPLRDELEHGGRAAMLYDLLQHPIDGSMLRHPPSTKAKREVMTQGLKPIERWWYEKLLEGSMSYTAVHDSKVEHREGWPDAIQKEQLHQDYLKGWIVDDRWVFVDDGISGAEFERRPGFMRLMGMLPRPPFQRLVVSEQKSIGREMSETAMAIKQLAQSGVEIFEYMHGRSLTPKNAMEKVVGALQGFGDEAHREQTSERVHEAHARLVKAGRVVGGRVFGYRNRVVYNGVDRDDNPLRSHVELEVNATEAAVVRRIFELYDSGEGLKRIAMQLNAEGAACPKPFVRKDPMKVQPVGRWAPSTVRSILGRELYRGVVVWNKSRKRQVAWGQVNQKPRPESEWLQASVPHLRIVDDALWKRVHARRRESETLAARLAGGRLSGRPPKTPTQNLLAGLATCALCGGGLAVETSPRKRGRVPEYVCYRHRANGSCTNALRMPVADMNEAVLHEVEVHALTPEAIEQVIHLSERDDVTDLQTKLARERKDVEKRIARLTAAIELGEKPATLVAKIAELEARLKAIAGEVACLRPVPRLAPAVIENRLAEWRRLLRASTTQGRTVLQRILRGRLTFTPRVNPITGEVDGYDFTAPTRYDRLFTGIAVEAPKPRVDEGVTGAEGIGPEDTFDGDYGRLLDRAYQKSVKVVTSPTGTGGDWTPMDAWMPTSERV
jgi:DNA invertase Pin-like site-specific DNA recombinase